MSDIDLEVFTDGDGVLKVHGNPNRQFADPGEKVTWHLINTAGRNLRVEFLEFRPPGGPKTGTSPRGPFSSDPASQTGRIDGTVRSGAHKGLYIYRVFDGETKLDWDNPIAEGNFGGIDVPRPPGG